MKKVLSWAFAAALICGASVFTSCSTDDNPVNPADNLAEKIIGKWIMNDFAGESLPTNGKAVLDFVSATKAYVSASIVAHSQIEELWNDHTEYAVEIKGNKVTLNHEFKEEGVTITIELTVNSITSIDIKTDMVISAIIKGQKMASPEMPINFKRVNRDYSETILGLWECKGLKGGETYNDGNDRLEFFEDGTYNYYRKNDAGEWEAVTTREFQDYFVDGTLLATRWKNVDENELREWWEIAYLKGDKMQWKALRANEDDSTFEQITDWEKVEED